MRILLLLSLLFAAPGCGDRVRPGAPDPTALSDVDVTTDIVAADAAVPDVGGAETDTDTSAVSDARDAADDVEDADGTNQDTDDADTPSDVAAADSTADDADVDAGPPPCNESPLAIGEPLAPSDAWRPVEVDRCGWLALSMAIPTEATWDIELRGAPETLRASVQAPRWVDLFDSVPPPQLLAPIAPSDDGTLRLSVAPPRGGEWWLALSLEGAAESAAIEARLACRAGCERETTRFPIILQHGYAGVDTYFGVLDYFFRVVDTLEDAGYTVYTPVVSPIATSEDRAEELAEQLDEILRETGARKVHIVAHSQGGLDARVLVSGLGYADRVETLTTLATPHLGSDAALLDFFSPQNFSRETLTAFNDAYPNVPEVRYFSWSFRSCQLLQFGCLANSSGELVDALLVPTHTLLSRFGDNDGIVPTESMRWGEWLGLRFADHFDQVGQIADFGLGPDAFDHLAFYLDEARRLRDLGG